jgi:hypothetical protein
MEPTESPQPTSPKNARSRDSDESARRAKANSKRTIAWVTAVGTLLAGVAAIAGVGWKFDWPWSTPEPPIESLSAIADVVEREAAEALPALGASYTAYSPIGTGVSTVRAPVEWAQRGIAPWYSPRGDTLGTYTAATTDILEISDERLEPGVWLGTSDTEFDPHEIIDYSDGTWLQSCDDNSPEHAFDGAGYEGAFRVWSACVTGDTAGSVIVEFVAVDTMDRGSTVLRCRLIDARDLTAFREAITSLERIIVTPQPLDQPDPVPGDGDGDGDGNGGGGGDTDSTSTPPSSEPTAPGGGSSSGRNPFDDPELPSTGPLKSD